jgi:hypothetical protein
MKNACLRSAFIACALAVAGACLPAGAATGIAWDSVVKLAMDGSVPAPGNFADDFQTASQTSTPPPQRGGLFGGITNAIGAAGYAMGAMRNGFAQRHYVAGNFVRSDDLNAQTATVVDCQARTITTLDLAKKTYRVASLDAPVAPAPSGPSGRPAPGAAPTDDGSKIDIKMTGSALGPKTIDNLPTDGYAFTMATTVTKPGAQPQTMNVAMTAYYSAFSQPAESCGRAGIAAPAAPGVPNMAMYQQMMRAATAPSGDPRVTVSASGPAPPAGRFPLYTAISPKASGAGSFAMLIENGHVRQISDADKNIFGVPPDFVKIP